MTKHHHPHKDDATRFRERSLNAIALRRQLEKWGKIVLLVIAVIMILSVIYVYLA